MELCPRESVSDVAVILACRGSYEDRNFLLNDLSKRGVNYLFVGYRFALHNIALRSGFWTSQNDEIFRTLLVGAFRDQRISCVIDRKRVKYDQ